MVHVFVVIVCFLEFFQFLLSRSLYGREKNREGLLLFVDLCFYIVVFNLKFLVCNRLHHWVEIHGLFKVSVQLIL